MSITQLCKVQSELTRFWTGQSDDLSILANSVDIDGCKLYGELIRFGLHDVMSSVYPACAELLGEELFDKTVEAYLHAYPPDHHNLNQFARRFPYYLQEHGTLLLSRYPFLVDLTDYEWLELEVLEHNCRVVEHPRRENCKVDEFLQLVPIVNPSLKVRSYAFDVSSFVDGFLSGSKTPESVEQKQIVLAAFRHPQTLECKFLELAEIGQLIVKATIKQIPTYKDLMLLVMPLSPVSGEDFVLEFLELLERLHDLKVFVGEIDSEKEK